MHTIRVRRCAAVLLALLVASAAAVLPASAGAAPGTSAAAPQPVTLSAVPARGGVDLLVPFGTQGTFRVLRSTGANGPESVVAASVELPWRDESTVLGTRYTYRVITTVGDQESAPSQPATSGPLPEVIGQEGTFTPIDPVRVLDTRDGTGGRSGPLGRQQTMTFDPAASGAVPSEGVSAVLLNVTGTEPSGPTHVRVWPSGQPMPGTSSLNLAGGQSRPNQVVVAPGADGRVSLYNNTGSTHLVVDVQGFYSTVDGVIGSQYRVMGPRRVLDTREDDWPLGPGEEVLVDVTSAGGVGRYAAAVEVNITVTEPTHPGHLTAWAGDVDPPHASNVNFEPGQTVANRAVVPMWLYDPDPSDAFSHTGVIAIRNSNGETHVIIDVTGSYEYDSWFGYRFTPVAPSRVADSRLDGAPVPPLGSLVVPPAAMPPGVAHMVNVTSTGSTGPGHLTAWSGRYERPQTSTVNYARGEDSPNLATVVAGEDGRIVVTANSSPSHVVVDHVGYFW